MERSLFAPKPSARTIAITNERVKLTASYVNTVAGSIFTVGGLAPIFATLYAPTAPSVPVWIVIGISLICCIASTALHHEARRFLREIQ